MDYKTGITALTIALSPVAVNAQKNTPKAVKNVAVNTAKISKESGVYGKVLVRQSLKNPELKLAPNPNLKDTVIVKPDKSQVKYDAYGNISAMINSKGQCYRDINREADGTLIGYSDNTFKKNGHKDTETVYYNGWGKDGSVAKFAEHKYHGNGTATVINFDDSGKILQSNKYNTKIIDGEEQITTLIRE